jgi:hypothetical protein
MLELEGHLVTMLKSSALQILLLSGRYLIVSDQFVCVCVYIRAHFFPYFFFYFELMGYVKLLFALLLFFQAVMMRLSNIRNEIVSRQVSTLEDASHLTVDHLQLFKFVLYFFRSFLLLSGQ